MTQIPLSGRFRQTATRKRSTGSYVSGRYVRVSSPDLEFSCSVQPPTSTRGHDILKDLPEAQRTTEIVVVYCAPGTLQTAYEGDNIVADRVLFLGKTYEVQRISFWPGQILTHDQAYCTRVDND